MREQSLREHGNNQYYEVKEIKTRKGIQAELPGLKILPHSSPTAVDRPTAVF
jgi:hypothetical protein